MDDGTDAVVPFGARNDISSVGSVMSSIIIQAQNVTDVTAVVMSPDAERPLTGAEADEAYHTALDLEMGWDAGIEDLPRIEKLYRSAAAAGHADAMARMGLIAEGSTLSRLCGEYTPAGPAIEDVVRALDWYQRSALHGSAFGAFRLGILYEEQFGRAADALKWYEKAVDGGNRSARERYDGLRKRLALGLGALAGAKPLDTTGLAWSHTRDDGAGGKRMNNSYEDWINKEWDGSEALAVAFCVSALAEACGDAYGEWGTLTEQEQSILLRHFSVLHPTKIALPAVAFEYAESIGEGNLRTLARTLLDNTCTTMPQQLAPVWTLKQRQNRVSTREFTYFIRMAQADFEAMLGAIDTITTTTPRGYEEPVLDLKMTLRELTFRHGQYSGHGDWSGVSAILTPEYLARLLELADQRSRDSNAPREQRALWQRIGDSLRSARAEPFDR